MHPPTPPPTPPPGYYVPRQPIGMTIGAIWTETVRLFRRHSTLWMALAALQVIPQLLLGVVVQATGVADAAAIQLDRLLNEYTSRVEAANGQDLTFLQDFPWKLPTNALVQLLVWTAATFFVQYFIFRTLAMGASVAAVGEAYRTQEPRFGQALGVALQKIASLLAWAILAGIGFFGLFFLVLIPFVGFFLWIGALVVLAMRLLLVPQIIVAEDTNVFTAMGRSWELTRGSFWRMLGAWLLFVVVVGIVTGFITSIVSGLIGAIAGPDAGITLASTQGISTIVGLISTPIAYIAFTLLYYDQHRRAVMVAPPPPPMYTPHQGG